MLFLKSLIFLPANMLIAFLLVSAFRAILFYPRKELRFRGKKIPFTPAIIPKYYSIIMEKINDLVYGFLHDLESDYEGNRISRWEKLVFMKCFKLLEKKIQSRFIPQKILHGIRIFLAETGREFARQFLRSFIPYLLETYHLVGYMETFNETFTLEFLQGYYDRYVYKYSLYLFMGFALIIGITNQIIYLIMGG